MPVAIAPRVLVQDVFGRLGRFTPGLTRPGTSQTSPKQQNSDASDDHFQPTRYAENLKEAKPPENISKQSSVERPVRPVRELLAHRLISHRDGLADVASDLAPAAADGIALDVETYGEDALDPRRGEIRLLTLQRKDGTPWILDLKAVGYDLGPVGTILSGAVLIIHNARFDLGFLRTKCGLRADGRIVDTLTASRLLSAGTNHGNRLENVLSRHLGVEIPKGLGKSDWSGFLLDDQLNYAAEDVVHLHALREKLRSELTSAGLGKVWELEEKVLHVVLDLTANGFAVDEERLHSIRERAIREAVVCGDKIRGRLGGSFNMASPKQLTTALRGAGFEVDSTDVETVRTIGDADLVASIVGYREAEKLAQQAQSLLDASHHGRIHAGYDPTGTATGRFSCKDPNLQNVARGELRECFIAPEGRSLVVCDYSQVELRLAAFIAKDERMVETFKGGQDLHTMTASTVLGVPVDQVSKTDRQLAKAVNFGLLYGQSARGLVRYAKTTYGVEISEERAREIRDKFFHTYSGLAQWHEASRTAAKRIRTTEARTVLGRRRLLPERESKRGEWGRFTDLVNTPVQGTAADGLKAALVLIHERLPADAHIVSTVHDEVVVECPEPEASAVLSLVRTSMVEALEGMVDVPVEVEGGVGRTWGGAKG
jgi:DNA polymerase-1